MLRKLFNRIAFIGLATLGMALGVSAAEPLQLQKGDHICIVGNTLAERMQHYGWLETLLHAQYPQHELVFRNLGYSGDEVNGFRDSNKRMRSMDFGSFDQWLSGNAPCPQVGKLSKRDEGKVRENRFELTNTKADVIFAFFGYNESFAGEAGLAKFKEDLTAFIKHVQSQKYNGKSAPKLVLFSPLAHELLNDPNLPNAEMIAADNARLKMYSAAMAEIAKTNEVLFIDLFGPTVAFGTAAPSSPARPITINGVHINDKGDMWLAVNAMDQLVGGKRAAETGEWWKTLESLRKTVNDKNFFWYHRHRVTDGFSTYGDRAFLKFSEGPGGYGDGLSNYSVGQRELDVLDTLTSNRDKVIWAAAQGQSIKPEENNLPEFLQVISNKPGSLDGGKHLFLHQHAALRQRAARFL